MWFKINRLLFLFASFVYLCACSQQTDLNTNMDMSLCAFIISDNDLDDHTDYIEKDIVKGLKGCPIGTELFLYVDRKEKKAIIEKTISPRIGKGCENNNYKRGNTYNIAGNNWVAFAQANIGNGTHVAKVVSLKLERWSENRKYTDVTIRVEDPSGPEHDKYHIIIDNHGRYYTKSARLTDFK